MPRALLYLVFFLSGAAALVYEVVWARSLALVFGASHLALSTVLAVYMGGLALGSRLLAGPADRSTRPLRLYGLLEVGIALSAVGFLVLSAAYPRLYAAVAGPLQGRTALLTLLRGSFALAAMIVPTTLMGGTLPVMARAMAREGGLAQELSRLYALNTLGAVTGTLAAAFVLLRGLGATATQLVAIATSASVGVAAIVLARRLQGAPAAALPEKPVPPRSAVSPEGGGSALLRRLTLLGIAASGFCALGYEVLWTRMLTLVVGTSVYSFAIMLAAFLAGIGLGSHAFGMLEARLLPAGERGRGLAFGSIQVFVGATALAVTVLMAALPSTVLEVQRSLTGLGGSAFRGRLFASGVIAFGYMLVPAFFMGAAFPAATSVWAETRRDPGGTVGRLLAANTVGAVLGPIVSGFFLVRFFGVERSLQMLVIVNLAVGAALAAAVAARRALVPIALAAAALLALRVGYPDFARAWSRQAFATFVNNTQGVGGGNSPREIEIVYFREGVNETVSVTRSVGGVQTYVVNGRPEASTHHADVQLQRALGHLPMLLHPNPRSAYVLGAGSGMTLGAIARDPRLERLVLAEIEAEMIPVARTFARWNGNVLDDPRLRIVIDDGRGFLSATPERFDVISTDPIHPWSGGAGYLYTAEYFRIVAGRLAPGGIASQWLPLYELSERDVKTVMRTFSQAFSHVLVFVTFYDALLLGSNDPLLLDREAVAARMTVPAIREDLSPVRMGSADELLDYFMMGTEGVRAFAADGEINTDDNLVLEFSAPEQQGVPGRDAHNILALAPARESPAPYVAGPRPLPPEEEARWSRHLWLGRMYDPAHARFLLGDPTADSVLDAIEDQDPSYAPVLFLRDRQRLEERRQPALVAEEDFQVGDGRGRASLLRLSAVRQYLGRRCVVVSIVDNARRKVYGERYLKGRYEELDAVVQRWTGETLEALRREVGRLPEDPRGLRSRAQVDEALRRAVARIVGPPTCRP